MKGIKKIAVFLLAVFCLSALSGCMRLSTTVKVKKNGKADISMLVAAMDTSDMSDDIDDEDYEIDEETKKELEDEGWEYEPYKDDNYVGYIITKKNVDLDDISKEMNNDEAEVDLNTDKFKITKKGTTYHLTYDVSSSEDMEEMDDGEDYSSYITSSGGYVKFILELPYKPKSHNAHKVSKDGKTLTWNLLKMEDESIDVEFSLINWPLIIGIIIGLIVIIAAVVVVIIILSKKNKNKVPNQGYTYPGQMNYQYPNQQYYPEQGQQYTYDQSQQYNYGQGQQYNYNQDQQNNYNQQYNYNQGQQYSQDQTQQYAPNQTPYGYNQNPYDNNQG